MNAEEARKIAKQSQIGINPVMIQIEYAAKNGQYSINLYNLPSAIETQLINEGFRIHHNGLNFSKPPFTISW